ncbi:MAG: hypothetical protein AAGA48_07940 [Myxococcota bacterium]
MLMLLAFALGCAPTCDQVCRKTLFDCDLSTERVALATCVDQCDRQLTLYQDQWMNDELASLFADHRRCLMRESCEEIADGVCYEGFEDLFVIDEDRAPLSEDPFNPNAAVQDTGESIP